MYNECTDFNVLKGENKIYDLLVEEDAQNVGCNTANGIPYKDKKRVVTLHYMFTYTGCMYSLVLAEIDISKIKNIKGAVLTLCRRD